LRFKRKSRKEGGRGGSVEYGFGLEELEEKIKEACDEKL